MVQLSVVEARVLGVLIEKEINTPEYYPLSLNAAVNACNQKSSREPVMELSEAEVRTALFEMDQMGLVKTIAESRATKFEHRVRDVLNLRRDEVAVMCLLLLRGAADVGGVAGADGADVFVRRQCCGDVDAGAVGCAGRAADAVDAAAAGVAGGAVGAPAEWASERSGCCVGLWKPTSQKRDAGHPDGEWRCWWGECGAAARCAGGDGVLAGAAAEGC